MRSIFHQILARYLASDQHAFDAYSHELWPEPVYDRQDRQKGARGAQEQGGQRTFHALERQS
jgi:hypothetical protein